ncbi:hypothetical protein M5G22_19985 [Pseudomonas sp. TNT2022 ID233]|jgi:hypothetical protein|uniref:hypothetical protein n=1 Tax=Pseudomonas aphyarum TaxID=2942629 RepID=UPI002362D4EA|nr:hypothetical protein [Pseudomonas aphyarum]MDD1139846.1 hypothetical protein [Pseudomonas aphyarum]
MSEIWVRRCSYGLCAILLTLTASCSSKPHYATTGDRCYAKAVPTSGEGGLAWGATLGIAQKKSMNNCVRYAGRSGGTPNTCQVVLAKCKN